MKPEALLYGLEVITGISLAGLGAALIKTNLKLSENEEWARKQTPTNSLNKEAIENARLRGWRPRIFGIGLGIMMCVGGTVVSVGGVVFLVQTFRN